MNVYMCLVESCHGIEKSEELLKKLSYLSTLSFRKMFQFPNPFKEAFHWTTRYHSRIFVATSAVYVVYYNAHDLPLFRKFIKHGNFIPTDNSVVDMMEKELVTHSERRKLPLAQTRFALGSVDALESKTHGSFHFTTAVLFRLSTRIALPDVDTIRKHYPNLMKLALGRGYNKISLETESLKDEDLKKFLLSPDAKKYAIMKEICKADSMAEMFLPVVTLVFTTLSTLALLMGLRLVIPFDVVSLILTTLANYSLFYMLSRALMQYYEKIYEKHVFERGETYTRGCREYLEQSIELGKFLYQHGERKLFSENGDFLTHRVVYSKRLEILEEYRKKLQQTKRRRKVHK